MKVFLDGAHAARILSIDHAGLVRRMVGLMVLTESVSDVSLKTTRAVKVGRKCTKPC